MLTSAELRWFWNGPQPKLQEWFSSSPDGPAREEKRTDHYLSESGQRELGIKRRGAGRGVEIKALVGEGATHTIGSLTTRTQIWTKVWTAALDLKGLRTIQVHKHRRMRSYPSGGYASGCNVEVTEVRVDAGSDVWTTLGFEAFGQLDRLETNLARVVLAHQSDPPAIDAGQALSYPAWLSTLVMPQP